jgi:hypothetical protein
MLRAGSVPGLSPAEQITKPAADSASPEQRRQTDHHRFRQIPTGNGRAQYIVEESHPIAPIWANRFYLGKTRRLLTQW